MVILKPGKTIPDADLVGTCQSCGCMIQCKCSEIPQGRDDAAVMKCPTPLCRELIWVYCRSEAPS